MGSAGMGYGARRLGRIILAGGALTLTPVTAVGAREDTGRASPVGAYAGARQDAVLRKSNSGQGAPADASQLADGGRLPERQATARSNGPVGGISQGPLRQNQTYSRPQQQQTRHLDSARVSSAHDGEPLDTEHLFGFAEGSDIGQPGETELETETTGRFGKRHGRFSAIDAAISLKAPVTDNFRVSPGFIVSRHDIHGMPDQTDRHATTVDGAFLDMRFRLLDRASAPFGLTLGVTPGFGSVEPGTGLRSREYGADFTLFLDREIIPGQLIAALNLSYDMGVSRPRAGGGGRASGVDLIAGLSWRLTPDVFVGAEARYARAYDGLGLDRYAGHALFAGPTLYVSLGSHLWVSVAWHVQVAGGAGRQPGRLDLDQFERHQVRLRVGSHF